MTLAIEAIFEKGVLKPVQPLHLAEQQKVRLFVDTDALATAPVPKRWHWEEAQALEDHFGGAVADELIRQRRES
jgi:predicted DNA-binding antitoxin AbrB/MazE fold protein